MIGAGCSGWCRGCCLQRRGRIDAVTPILSVMGDAIGMRDKERARLLIFGEMGQNTPGPPDQTFLDSFNGAATSIEWVLAQCDRTALVEDSFGARIYASADRGEIDASEAPNLLLAFLGAGIDTTVAGIINAIKALSDLPDQWRQLRARPALARAAFEERLRYDPPVRFATRVARKDTLFAGAQIHKGDGMLLFFSAAARDPRKWEEPDRYDLERNTIGHLTFGKGIHNCVGQMMARMEALALLEALAEQAPGLEVVGTGEIQRSNQLHSFSHLPVTVRFELPD